jgi:hypothetical protein
MILGPRLLAARLRTEHSSVLSRIATQNQDFSRMLQVSPILGTTLTLSVLLRCYRVFFRCSEGNQQKKSIPVTASTGEG